MSYWPAAFLASANHFSSVTPYSSSRNWTSKPPSALASGMIFSLKGTSPPSAKAPMMTLPPAACARGAMPVKAVASARPAPPCRMVRRPIGRRNVGVFVIVVLPGLLACDPHPHPYPLPRCGRGGLGGASSVVAGLLQIIRHLACGDVEGGAAAGAGLQRLVELDAEQLLDLGPVGGAGPRQHAGVGLLQADGDQAVAGVLDGEGAAQHRHRAGLRQLRLGCGTGVPL